MKQIRLQIGFLFCLFLLKCSPYETETALFRQWFSGQETSFDLLIHSGKLYNGNNATSIVSDVLVRGDSIVFVGKVDTTLIQVKQKVNASGKIVCPGFIDTHAHGDPLYTPGFANFLAMGVTTICLGQDGASPKHLDIRPWMERVSDTIPGTNIALFAGHGTLRHLSGIGYETTPSQSEVDHMNQLLQNALEAGCFGLSTGLEYTPGTYAGDEELLRLAKTVGQYDGVIMSHVRNEDNDAIEASLDELLRQGQHANVHVAHLKVVYGKGEKRAEEILAKLAEARKGPYRVTADLYPYTASFTGIGIVFPAWAKPPNDYQKVKKQRRQELLDFLHQKVMARNGPEATLFGTGAFAGKTLAQLSEEQQKPFPEILLDMGPGGASAAYFVMDETLQARLLQDSLVMVCSDGSPRMRHPRGYGSFARIIEHFVLEEEDFPLEEAIRKMTSLSAQTLGLPDRGLIKPGYKADLLVFDPKKVKAQATFAEPHQLASGFEWVFVNGQAAIANGKLSDKRYGRMLRKNR